MAGIPKTKGSGLQSGVSKKKPDAYIVVGKGGRFAPKACCDIFFNGCGRYRSRSYQHGPRFPAFVNVPKVQSENVGDSERVGWVILEKH
jgi:hypothetical protein